MTEEELRELLRRFREGDERAGERVLLQLQPLVRAYARRMAFRESEEEDYFQVGMIGLLKAAQRFNPDRGVKFVTFALSWIEGEMRLYRRETQTAFKMSRSLIEQSRRLASCREQLTQSLKREPAVGEIAHAMGVSVEEIALIMESALPLSPFDEAELTGREGLSEQEKLLERMALHESMIRLTPLEQRLIALRFYKELTQSEIAGRLTLSQRQVSRLEKRALHQLRAFLQPEG
jgi:RNA polymerase sporulation-specific sigma factor